MTDQRPPESRPPCPMQWQSSVQDARLRPPTALHIGIWLCITGWVFHLWQLRLLLTFHWPKKVTWPCLTSRGHKCHPPVGPEAEENQARWWMIGHQQEEATTWELLYFNITCHLLFLFFKKKIFIVPEIVLTLTLAGRGQKSKLKSAYCKSRHLSD